MITAGRLGVVAIAATVIAALLNPALAQSRRPGSNNTKCNQLGSAAACVKCAISRGFKPEQYEPYCGVKK